jgi:hypothetical protein
MSDTTSKDDELLIELNKYIVDEDMPVVKQLITAYGIQERIDVLESLSKSTTASGVPYFAGVESSIIIERLDQLTALKDKEES